MGHTRGRVIEIRLDASGQVEAWIACSVEAIPGAGQYLLASNEQDADEVLGTPLFLAEKAGHGFWAASPIPPSWSPGVELALVGPLGHGFSLPRDIQRLGLVAMGHTAGRLIPLVQQKGATHRTITLFTDLSLPALPSSLEAYPLSSLVEALDWPDYMLVDLSMERLPELRPVLGLPDGGRLPFPAQVLITSPMPCAGVARCGACAVPTQRGWKLACEEGPVFDLTLLKW